MIYGEPNVATHAKGLVCDVPLYSTCWHRPPLGESRAVLFIARWRVLDHGYVEVTERGLTIHDTDEQGMKLFTTMFQERLIS